MQVQRRDGYLRIRYYPSGVITDPKDRVWSQDRWDPCDPAAGGEAQAAAERLRRTLYAHRAAHGIVHSSTAQVAVTVKDSVAAFVVSLQEEKKEQPPAPAGTVAARATQLQCAVCVDHGDREISELAALAPVIVTALMTATNQGGAPLADTTRNGRLDALAVYGRWIEDTYAMQNPFAVHVATARKGTTTVRERALAKVTRPDPFADGDRNGRVRTEDVPSLHEVIGLRDAVIRRETLGSPRRNSTGRGSGGGAPPLDKEAANQFAESVTFGAASGLRRCEALGVHTSRIRLDEGVVRVDRQLDRYKLWVPGAQPPLVPPKFNIERNVLVWPSYREKLQGLVDYANEHSGAWLFAPTRGQRRWADAASNAIQRAVDLLDEEHDEAVTETSGTTEAPVRWKHTFHSLRHLYVSQSLAPVDAGGLGWSLPFVQRCVGHSSSTITESVYGHIVRDEFEVARAVHHAWPGL